MKLQPDQFDDVPLISGHGPGWVAVAGEKIHSSFVISSRGQRFEWNCERFDQLDAAHFEQLAELDVEMVIFGSGERLHFPPPQWTRALVARQVGLETMDTPAACRTYNILAGEGRHVAAALIIEPLLPSAGSV